MEVSQRARQCLHWFDYYQSHGRNAARPCRYLGINRQTFYRWRRRYDPQNLARLDDRSHWWRQPTWRPRWVEHVLSLRRQYPRWGKDKLEVLRRREGCRVSTSMRGRLLAYLKKRGWRVEPLPGRRVRRPRALRPWAGRKPRD